MEKVEKDQVEASKKSKYEKPSLIEYGSLDELTLSGGSGAADFLGTQDDAGMGNNGMGMN